ADHNLQDQMALLKVRACSLRYASPKKVFFEYDEPFDIASSSVRQLIGRPISICTISRWQTDMLALKLVHDEGSQKFSPRSEMIARGRRCNPRGCIRDTAPERGLSSPQQCPNSSECPS